MPLWAQLGFVLLLLAGLIAYAAGEFIHARESTQLLARAQIQIEQQLLLLRDGVVEILLWPEAAAATAPAEGPQQLVLNKLLGEFTRLVPHVDQLEIVGADGQRIIGWRRPGAETNKHVPLVLALAHEGVSLGVLQAGWDASDSYALTESVVAGVRATVFVVLLIMVGALLLWLRILVIRPLNLVQQRLQPGAANTEIPIPSWMAAEFQHLMRAAKRIDEVTVTNDKLAQEMERRKDAEVALLSLRDEALDANRAKSVFLANMSHELRTPLNAILGYSEILGEEVCAKGHAEYAKDLERINQAGRHLLVLINEVLDISKIEAGKMELHLEAFHFHEIVNVVVMTVQPMMLKNGNVIRIEGVNSIPPMRGDVTRVRQILFNLLSNAIKFTDHGEIVLSVKPQARNDIDGLELLVTDSGIGLSAEDIDMLFVPFQQVDTSTTRKYGGTGLGLSLCRHLCEMMQGEIWVESEAGHGATFGVWLPLSLDQPLGIAPATYCLVNAGPDPKSVRLPDEVMRRMQGDERRKRISTVLTIDDDPNVLDLMARVYQREGFRPVSATNGKAGIELARQLRPDLITLDIMMPEMDGWSVLKALKEDPELKDIPVIMVSIVENKPMALDVGALDSLTKPIAWDRLLDLTRNIVRNVDTKSEE
ncbi:MAG: ATP-binding protein [Gammaproteobacteria bacterium]|nr:ATP-binding protein [Gammaproteobacteria bacterium]